MATDKDNTGDRTTQAMKPIGIRRHVIGTSLALALLGALVTGFWLITNDGSTTSMLLLLAGISLLALSVILFFFSPSRYLRDDVSDALGLSNTLALHKVLSSLMVQSKGVYISDGPHGPVKVFLPLSALDGGEVASIVPGSGVFNVAGPIKGISLVPPGYGLFRYAVRIGAVFTDEGIENEIKDVMERGMELASSVNVKREGDRVVVSLRSIVNQGMCRSIRSEDPGICLRTGCPICSFAACMVSAGTGKKVRLDHVSVNGGTIHLTYELI